MGEALSWEMVIHESAHAVVADALGFEVACIEPQNDGMRCGILSPETPTAHEHFALAAFSLAGGIAQQIDGGEPGPECQEDLGHAYDSVIAYGGEKHAEGNIARVVGLVTAILRHRWKAVERLAGELKASGGYADRETIAVTLGSDPAEGEVVP